MRAVGLALAALLGGCAPAGGGGETAPPPGWCALDVHPHPLGHPLDGLRLGPPVTGFDARCLWQAPDVAGPWRSAWCAPAEAGRILDGAQGAGGALVRVEGRVLRVEGGVAREVELGGRAALALASSDGATGWVLAAEPAGGQALLRVGPQGMDAAIPLRLPDGAPFTATALGLRSPEEPWVAGDALASVDPATQALVFHPVAPSVLQDLRNVSIAFAGDALGVVVRSPPADLLLTTDGGASFARLPLRFRFLDAVALLSPTRILALSEELYESRDGGASFHVAPLGPPPRDGRLGFTRLTVQGDRLALMGPDALAVCQIP